MLNIKVPYLWAFLFNLPKAVAANININGEKRQLYATKSSTKKNNSGFILPTEGILMIDPLGKIVQLNPAAIALFHYDPFELLGKSVELVVPAGGLLPAIDNKRDISPDCWYARKKDGTQFPARLSASYFQQPAGQFTFILVTAMSGKDSLRFAGH